MDDRVRFALEKLLNVAHEDSGQGRRVATCLLAWWNAEVHGGFDLTDLADALGTRKKLMFSLSAAPVSELVSYRSGKDVNDVSELAVSGKGASFWRANETLLADIVIRRQQAEKLFGLLDVPPRK